MSKREVIKAIIKIVFTWQAAKYLLKLAFFAISFTTAACWLFLLFPTILTALEGLPASPGKQWAEIILLTVPMVWAWYVCYRALRPETNKGAEGVES